METCAKHKRGAAVPAAPPAPGLPLLPASGASAAPSRLPAPLGALLVHPKCELLGKG